MTFVPLLSEDFAVSEQMTAVVISAVLQLIICIPLLIFTKKHPMVSITEVAGRKKSFIGFLLIAICFLFFVCETADSLLSFQIFLGDRFFKTANPYLWIGVFLVICVYCAIIGIEGIARSSTAVFVILIIMLITMAVTSARDFDPVNIYVTAPKGTIIFAVIDELAKNGEIVALAFLCKYIPAKLGRTVYGLLIGKVILTLAVLTLIQGVLGDFAMLTDYPFLAVGAYAGVNFLQRADAVYLVVWTMTAVLKTALYINISAGLLTESFPKLRGSAVISAAIIYLITLPFLKVDTTLSAVYGSLPFVIAQVIIVFLAPLIEIIFLRKEMTHEKITSDISYNGNP
jgi:spore germination protein KB